MYLKNKVLKFDKNKIHFALENINSKEINSSKIDKYYNEFELIWKYLC